MAMTHPLRTFGAVLAVLMLAGAQAAQAVTLMPLTLVMAKGKTVVSLHVQNDEGRPKIFEVQAFRWSQVDGEDRLEPAPDLVVTPPIVKLAAGEEKLIRVGVMRADPNAGEEKAYRLLLRDITPASEAESGLKLRMQYLLPLFMAPGKPVTRISTVAAGAEKPGCLRIANTGNIHAKLVWTAPESAPDKMAPTQKYVLAGREALVCSQQPVAGADGKTEAGGLMAGITSAYQDEVTAYEVVPAHN